jgi:hypothetical protein
VGADKPILPLPVNHCQAFGGKDIRVRPYSLDDYWDLLAERYHYRGRNVPRRWLLFYCAVKAILRWGAR